MSVRVVQATDVPSIIQLIKDLAEYEKALDEAQATEADLHAALFGDRPALFGHVAEHEGKVVGFALWFLNYSTWLGQHGIYLEDLYVSPAFRGQGYGTQLLKTLASVCAERGYGRFEWSVLNWNEPAIGLYKRLGAEPMDEWTTMRLTGNALSEFARG